MVGQQYETFFKFHPYHGDRIALSENNSVAYRTEGFDDGVVFSEKQLQPGEIFVIEIEQNQSRRRASYLRLGLTQLNPSMCASRKIELPKQAVPDLIMRLEESSWIYAVDDLLPRKREFPWPLVKGEYNVDISDQYIETCRGKYLKSSLRNTTFIKNAPKTMRNIEVGYKIGVVYIPRNDDIADLFFIFNGDLFGPYALEIPYKETPLYAAVDVYGRTQKVRILQIQAGNFSSNAT